MIVVVDVLTVSSSRSAPAPCADQTQANTTCPVPDCHAVGDEPCRMSTDSVHPPARSRAVHTHGQNCRNMATPDAAFSLAAGRTGNLPGSSNKPVARLLLNAARQIIGHGVTTLQAEPSRTKEVACSCETRRPKGPREMRGAPKGALRYGRQHPRALLFEEHTSARAMHEKQSRQTAAATPDRVI